MVFKFLLKKSSNSCRAWEGFNQNILNWFRFEFDAVCCKQVETVFAEMSSWTALTRHPGVTTIFSSKHLKCKYVRSFIMKNLIFSAFHDNAYKNSNKTQFNEFLVLDGCIILEINFLQSLIKFKIFIIKIRKYLLLLYPVWYTYMPC